MTERTEKEILVTSTLFFVLQLTFLVGWAKKIGFACDAVAFILSGYFDAYSLEKYHVNEKVTLARIYQSLLLCLFFFGWNRPFVYYFSSRQREGFETHASMWLSPFFCRSTINRAESAFFVRAYVHTDKILHLFILLLLSCLLSVLIYDARKRVASEYV